jgi:hypothetical protein
MLPKGSRFAREVEEKKKIPAKYVRIAAAAGVLLLLFIVYECWPAKKYHNALAPGNFATIRPGMSRQEVISLVDGAPGDYRTKNHGAADRFGDPPAGFEHVIWETDFGGYCVVLDSSTGQVIKVERKAAP